MMLTTPRRRTVTFSTPQTTTSGTFWRQLVGVHKAQFMLRYLWKDEAPPVNMILLNCETNGGHDVTE
jgi:hypothetical protein